jgi:hypothetical protein
MFKAENWENIYNAWADPWGYDQMPQAGKGTIHFKQCSDDGHVFTFDINENHYSPDPLKRSSTAKVHLAGHVSKPVSFASYKVTGYLNGHALYHETRQGGEYTSKWSYDLSYPIPFIAPPGHYMIKVEAMGAVEDKQVGGDIVLGCGTGEFDL